MEHMTDIDHTSAEWAGQVHDTIFKTRTAVQRLAAELRTLAEDMDSDGQDRIRGPHAPPVEEAMMLLKACSRILSFEESRWRNYHFNRAVNEGITKGKINR